MANAEVLEFLASRIFSWYKRNGRSLPWRSNPTPYKIWLAEIVFQQTRIEQGLEYYHKIIKTYPDVMSLSKADEKDILKLWQGLGYYTRAINLLKTARLIASNGGVFPSDVEQLKKLPGIGPYTAGAIASIAFGKREPLVDGNVQRVFSRFFGINHPVNHSRSTKIFYQIAGDLVRIAEVPSDHNQALMDLGSIVCKPVKPSCDACPISDACVAFLMGEVNKYPIKVKKNKKTDRYLIYGFCINGNQIAIQKRNASDIWKNLYQLPLLAEFLNQVSVKQYLKSNNLHSSNFTAIHHLSHQKLHIEIYPVEEAFFISNKIKYNFIEIDALKELAFPVPLLKFLSTLPDAKTF